MSKYTIRLNYRKATQQADRLDEIASRINNMANNEFEDTLNGIAAAWKGENSKEYLRKARNLKGSINNSASNLKSIADEIRRKAYRVYLAELDAMKIARERSDGNDGGGGSW